MSFRVRQLLEILDGMQATVLANSELDDVNRGSITRTILEAAALQDADQYLQIARLKNAFSINTATGTDLDERGADFDIDRLSPAQATGVVTFGDSNFTTKVENSLAGLTGIGSGTLVLNDASSFPASGAVIVERDVSGQREYLVYTSKAANTLTLSGVTAISHPGASSVILSTAGSDRVFPSGTKVYVPETEETAQLDFTTQASVTLLDGDITTTGVVVISNLTGSAMNVGTSRVSGITAPPFQTATVTNGSPFLGGRDEESDDDYRQRIQQTIAALSNGTINDLVVAASGVQLASGQRVITVQVVEEFADPDVSVYIDDGTGLLGSSTASQTNRELLIHKAEAGQKRARLLNWPVTGNVSLKKSDLQGGPGSATQIDSVVPGVGSAVCNITGAGFTPGALVGRVMVDDNRVFFTITANGANDLTVSVPSGPNPTTGSYAIFQSAFLSYPSAYLFNETTGDIELVSGLTLNGALAAFPNPTNAYTYYTGLIQEVQKTLNGDPTNLDVYPGVKAAGVKLKVRAPQVNNITISITILSTFGTVEADLEAAVKDAIQRYVNSLGIGADVILAEIIAAVMAIPGIIDCRVNTPTSNVPILDGYIPRTKSSAITVL